ncbi:hypothetical protein [Streptomyces yunnanensis]|nr:hypothetical protein [Streptomyces yunnanensis]
MHHHGYLWTGPKGHFDQEALRRPPPSDPPLPPAPGNTAMQALADRYRQVAAEFPVSGLPPIETAHWLAKPPGLIRGTWEEPKEAAEWLGHRLAEYAPRFQSGRDQDTLCLAARVASVAGRLAWGGDVSLGFYLERPAFLSLAMVTCSPNHTAPNTPCPTG